ncbi:MAG: ABC transporter permease subunit [Bacteroidota bacterium]|nr:ABC transporter permease subunit [Bacteroidota bacterium]
MNEQGAQIERTVKSGRDFSFKKYAWQQFKKNKPAYYSYRILLFLAVIALIAPFIATDQPLYCNYKGVVMFPAFSFSNSVEVKNPETGETEIIQFDIADWKHMELDAVVFAPVAYAPNKTDYDNADYVSPGGNQVFVSKEGETINIPAKFRHWLGTNKAGEDVLSGLINGTRVSLTIGILSMGIASFLGIVLGAMAGYFGDKKLKTTRGSFWTFVLGLVFAYYYAFSVRSYEIADGFATSGFSILTQLLISFFIFFLIASLFYFIGKQIGKISFLSTSVFIPVDSIISRLIEILVSIPLLILIISVAAIAKEKSIVNIMVIIGLTSWSGIARLTRAEFLRISSLEYIQAAKSMGFKEYRIIFIHALPNALAPALVAIAFGVASAILIESSLSFLGIGVPPDTVTWGSLLSAGREQFSAWWLVIFPGLAIFLTVTIYNLLGEGLRDALDPRLKK